MVRVALGVAMIALHCSTSASAEGCGQTETSDEAASLFNLSGKVIVVTGGDSGLGLATATTMSKMGAEVVIATHNLSKGIAAAEGIINSTGGIAHGYALDLASFDSVRAFAKKIIQDFRGRLDILFNNAGIATSQDDGFTGDGFETVFQTNYLGHFLLTELLLPALRDSSGRVVNTASTGHEFACHLAGLPHNCLEGWANIPPKPVSGHLPWYDMDMPKTQYGVSKMMMIQHAKELAIRESSHGVAAFSVGPGLVATPMTHQSSGWVSKLERAAFCFEIKHGKMHQDPCPYTAEQGAAVIAYAGLSATGSQSGAWLTRYSGCQAAEVVMNGFTDAMRPELYDKSLEWVGLRRQRMSGGSVLV